MIAAIERLPMPQRSALTHRIVDANEHTKHRAWDELAHTPCPLLEGGNCQLYEARPLPCRALGSTDANACAMEAEGERTPVPFDVEAYVTGIGIGAALNDTSGGHGHRELRSALAAMLITDAAGRVDAFVNGRRARADSDENADPQ